MSPPDMKGWFMVAPQAEAPHPPVPLDVVRAAPSSCSTFATARNNSIACPELRVFHPMVLTALAVSPPVPKKQGGVQPEQ
jgi:hypothetical protein